MHALPVRIRAHHSAAATADPWQAIKALQLATQARRLTAAETLTCACRTALHRALYWGHLQAAALLLEAGAQLSIQDHQVLSMLSTSLQQERDTVRANRCWSCTASATASQAYLRATSVLSTAKIRGMKAYGRLMQAFAGSRTAYDSQSLKEKEQESK